MVSECGRDVSAAQANHKSQVSIAGVDSGDFRPGSGSGYSESAALSLPADEQANDSTSDGQKEHGCSP